VLWSVLALALLAFGLRFWLRRRRRAA
jgi:hypothetical protein